MFRIFDEDYQDDPKPSREQAAVDSATHRCISSYHDFLAKKEDVRAEFGADLELLNTDHAKGRIDSAIEALEKANADCSRAVELQQNQSRRFGR